MNQVFTSFWEFKHRYPINLGDANLLLGTGTYGRVVKVEDQTETEWVAVKISEVKADERKTLKAEVELAQTVPRQANIARYDACYRLETDMGLCDFAVMKYYPDGNLADLLRRQPLTAAQINDVVRGILLGLQHLHRHHIIHRDFKPANILISRDNAGRLIPKIADFGLSKLVSEGDLDHSDFDLTDGRGTPSYKAPEQIEGSRVSFNLDLWAFGVILYEIMTGQKPFAVQGRNSSEQSVRRDVEKKILAARLPDTLETIAEPYQTLIRRCLVRDIRKRVRKEEELLDLLDNVPQQLADARAARQRQNWPAAISIYESLLAIRPKLAEAQQGLAECKAQLSDYQVENFLTQARLEVSNGRWPAAQVAFAQVLHLDPNHTEARAGLARCLNRQAVVLPAAAEEATDMYREEATDVYVVPLRDKQPQPIRVTPKPLKTPTLVQHLKPYWRYAAAASVIGMLGFGLYLKPTAKPHITTAGSVGVSPVPAVNEKAAVGFIPDASGKEKAITPAAAANPNAALQKRIDVAYQKAIRLYQRHDYKKALEMTNSALLLDPTRRELVALRDKAIAGMTAVGQTPTPAEAVATAPVEEVTNANALAEKQEKARQETQTSFEQLLEGGKNAIANGNNKTKAISEFKKAMALAGTHELNTKAADDAYTLYMNKANKILENGSYEGAKQWFEVAQSLKDTPDVRRLIKKCQNNL